MIAILIMILRKIFPTPIMILKMLPLLLITNGNNNNDNGYNNTSQNNNTSVGRNEKIFNA